MAVPMSTPDQISKHSYEEEAVTPLLSSCINSVYEVSKCVKWIQDKGLKRVALQFPDSLLVDSPAVTQAIQVSLGQEVFILGDTSYGECCVDEVAASHLSADGVIHFGHTCLTPSQSLPVLYIFTRRSCGKDRLIEEIKEKWKDSDEKVVLLYDVEYHHEIGDLSVEGVDLVIGRCDDEVEGGIFKFGRTFALDSSDTLSGCQVVYVGKGGHILLNFMFNLPNCNFFVFEDSSLSPAGLSVSKMIMKRYFLVEKTKDAERIGLLVGTLGTVNFGDIIERLRKIIKLAGKKAYTFLVGKPNVAKLANFPEIDVFVYVACPETTVIDSKEFLQPVITPYELELACNSGQEWSGQVVTDYRELLEGGDKYAEASSVDHEADVSLLTGKIRNMGNHVGEDHGEGKLMIVNDKTVSLLHENGGGQFLATRSWGGLEQKLGETDVAKVVDGRKGIASGYEGEAGYEELK